MRVSIDTHGWVLVHLLGWANAVMDVFQSLRATACPLCTMAPCCAHSMVMDADSKLPCTAMMLDSSRRCTPLGRLQFVILLMFSCPGPSFMDWQQSDRSMSKLFLC